MRHPAPAIPTLAAVTLLVLTLPAVPTVPVAHAAAQVSARPDDDRVAGAVLALPPALRADAEVRAADGETVLRAGSGDMICLADAPGDERFRVACYHRSLEPFMAMGRELRAEGVEGMAYQRARWEAAEAGRLEMPSGPAMVYNLGFPTGAVDPDTVEWTAGSRLHAIYTPFATPASTGLPTSPDGGGPWLMWPGEPSAHVMISVPSTSDEAGGGR